MSTDRAASDGNPCNEPVRRFPRGDMKRQASDQPTILAQSSWLELLDVLERCLGELRLHVAEHSIASGVGPTARTADDFDRFRWGRAVAASLAPRFDSREFARAYRAALPPAIAMRFNPVRLKKVLLRLCHDEVIEICQRGRGRTPAHYRVLPQRPRHPTKGRRVP